MYFKNLLRYRQVWLGIALLWIMLFHSSITLGPLDYFRQIGYGGVDICLFASGIGCYYSLSKDSDIGKFMKRRLLRLMPTYIIFIIVWLAVQSFYYGLNPQMVLGNLLTLQYFSGHENSFNWYISAALLLYFFAPYFKIIVDRSTPVRKYLFPVFLFVCSVPFWRADSLIIIASRFPIFYIGMLFAELCQKDRQISARHIVCAVLSFFLGIVSLAASFKWAYPHLWSYGLYWYPFILITPPLCMAISYCFILLEKWKFVKPVVSFLSLCGEYSFELYLVHILVFSLISNLIVEFHLANIHYIIWAASIVPLVFGCFVLRRLTMLFSRLCQKTTHPV